MRRELVDKKFPKGWTICRLSDVAQIQTGIAKSPAKNFDDVELPYLSVANVQAGRLDLKNVKTIRVQPDKTNRYRLQHGDVLLTEGGDFDKLGRGTIWKNEIPDCLHQNHIFVVRCDSAKVLPEWLSLVTDSYLGRHYFKLCSKQSTNLASINSTQLKAFPVPLLPLRIQENIIRLSSLASTTIQTTESLIAAKREQKRGLMQELLTGRRRFPGFDGEWSKWRLGDLVDVRIGGTPSRKNSSYWAKAEGDGFPWATISDLNNGLLNTTSQRITQTGVDDSNVKLVAPGTTMMSFKLTIGRVAIAGCPLYTNEAIAALVPRDEQVLDRFLFDAMPTVVARVLPDDAVKGKTLNKAKIEEIVISLPGLDEQAKISRMSLSLDTELTHLESLAHQLREQKRGLMQRLFSGDLDLSKLNAIAEEVSA